MNLNCGVGNRVFLTLWIMAIRSNMVASFEHKMPSKVLNRTFTRVGWPTIQMQKQVVVCQFKLNDVLIFISTASLVTSLFNDFCCFWPVAVNTMDILQFLILFISSYAGSCPTYELWLELRRNMQLRRSCERREWNNCHQQMQRDDFCDRISRCKNNGCQTLQWNVQSKLYLIRLAVDMKFRIYIHVHIHRFYVDIKQ